ncbi:hypothetical protein D3C74_446190 [compost metagenome]
MIMTLKRKKDMITITVDWIPTYGCHLHWLSKKYVILKRDWHRLPRNMLNSSRRMQMPTLLSWSHWIKTSSRL